MDSFLNRLKPLSSAWRSASGPQRWTYGLVVLAVAGGLFAAALRKQTTRYVPLSLGKQFGADELQQVEQTLRERRLEDYRREGNRILVPEDRVTQYDSALLESGELPHDWASDWEEKFESANPFTSAHELETMREIALAKELRRIILGLDGVADASVVWADPGRSRGWPSHREAVTASVNVTPRPETILPLKTIRAIQFAVANMVPNLHPQDVVVFDLANGRHYQLDADEARFETEFDLWLEREIDGWRHRISDHVLRHWKAASVIVSADEAALRDAAWIAWRQLRSGKNLAADRTETGGTFIPLTPVAPSPHRAGSSFAEVRSALTDRVPEFIEVRVEFSAENAADLIDENAPREVRSAVPNREQLQAIHAQVVASLPPAIRGDAVEVRVRTLAADEAHTAGAHPRFVRDVAPGTIVFAIAACLMLFAVSWRTMTRERRGTSTPTEADSESVRGSESVAMSNSEETSSATPLGDPDTVAAVLKAWTSRNPT